MAHRLKLAAIDLDGTLFGPDKTVSPENLAALRRLETAGVEVVVATGRHKSRIASALSHLPHTRWAVTSQGAAVLDLDRGVALDTVFLKREETQLLLELGARLGFTCLTYDTAEVRSDRHGVHTDYYARIIGGIPLLTPTAELVELPTHKIIWIGSEQEVSALPEHPAVRALSLYQVQSLPGMYEFLPLNVTKGSGVAALARRLGVEPSEVVAFGDADNDIPMFEWAGVSFAMAHGTPGARETAKHIASEGPPETAFARAVETLGLS